MPATYEPIATTTLGSAATTITFSSIAASYTDLRLVLVSSDGVGSSITMRFNSDTGSNYSRTTLNGNGTSAVTASTSNATSINIAPNNATAGLFGLYTIDVFSYAGSTNKTVLSTNSVDQNGSGQVGRLVGLWRNTAAITTITLTDSSNFAIGTTATLYGILRA
jgi:hypothetical protein